LNGHPGSEDTRLACEEQTLGDDVSFYTVTDERFFLGTIGMLNSLRLMGNERRVVVLDCGLTKRQRDVLDPECELLLLPDSQATNPQLLKPFANLMRPKGTVVILDSDIIVTRPLDSVLKAARNGQVCVCADPDSERWFAEWEQLFELRCPPRHQRYVSSGFVVFSVEHWPDLLPRWWNSCQRIRSCPTSFYEEPDSPTACADQDALNAILMSEWPEEALAIQPRETQPSMEELSWRVRLFDLDTLSCSLHDRPVTLIHPAVKTKPFQRQWWMDQGQSIYPALLRRLLVGGDVRVQVARDDVPIWLQSGLCGGLVTRVLYMVNRLGYIRKWLRDRLRKWELVRWAYKSLRGRLAGTHV
jgi:hypothetical protein